jgi:hypothetical protein
VGHWSFIVSLKGNFPRVERMFSLSNLYKILILRHSRCISHLLQPPWCNRVIIFGEITNYVAPHYTTFSIFLLLLFSYVLLLPQYLVPKHSHTSAFNLLSCRYFCVPYYPVKGYTERKREITGIIYHAVAPLRRFHAWELSRPWKVLTYMGDWPRNLITNVRS